MGVHDQPPATTTTTQRKIKHQPSPPESSSASTACIAAARPRKKLTNSRSIIKSRPRLGQTPLKPTESDPLAPQSSSIGGGGGIKIARARNKKLLSKSASFVRPKCSPNDSISTTCFSNATCSSKFRSTAFPDDGDEPHILLEMEATTPDAAGSSLSSSNKKVCPYTYCSCHGAGRPQLKRFGSIRRPAAASRPSYNKSKLKARQIQIKPSKANTTSPVTNYNDVRMQYIPAQGNDSKSMEEAKWHATDQNHQLQGGSEAPGVIKDDKPREENEKATRVWRLIYHSMLSAKYRSELYPPVSTDDNQVLQGIAAAAAAPVQENNLGVNGAERLAVTPTFESAQMDAVKLVEDAIDELFLPEVEEQLSNNPTTSSGASERDVHESKQNDISSPCAIDNVKEVKPFSKVGSESMSKNWSKLKQIVLLKRFVKALDKLNDLKFKEPRILNVEADPEMEKVRLRHQTTDEKRLADEWMLDYALRQVVAKLTPARRKKVELLIEAFETVIPLSSNGTPQSLNKSLSSYTVSSGHLSSEKAQSSSVPFKEVYQEGIRMTTDTKNTAQRPSLVPAKDTSEIGEVAGSLLSQNHPPSLTVHSPHHLLTEVASGVLDKFVSNTQTFRKLEHSLHDQSSTGTGLIGHYDDGLIKHTETKSIASLVRSFDSRYENTEAAKMTKIASALNCETAQVDSLMSNSGKQRDVDVPLDNQKYFKMWGMIYNHVVSGTAAKIGSELHITESMDGREAMDSKLDAVKLVEDALDEMLLPEYQDQSSDDQSITSDQDHLERVDSESGDSEILTPNDSVSFYFKDLKQMKAKTSGEACGKACFVPLTQEPNVADKKVSKINRLRSNNGWSNLKKFILLKRFIRALDKLKKFNPREANYLSLEPDQEPENVSLKRQTTDERLSAEQWMIDNAIQQVVARLTPARKRRVELLVEAFETVETVLPLPSARTPRPLKQSLQSAAYAKLF